jgi:hypothetical protein
MAEPDYSTMTDEDLLKAAQAAGVAQPTPPAKVSVNSTGTTSKDEGLSLPEIIGGGLAGAGATALALKFPEMRTSLANLAARSKMGAPMRQTAEAVLRDVGDTQAASQRLRDLAQKMRSLNSPQTVGDVLGPQGQNLAKAAVAQPGAASVQYTADLAARQQATPERLSQAVMQELGSGVPYSEQEQQFLKLQRDRSQPLYDAAYQQFPSVKSNTLMEILDDPAGQLASKNAVTELARRGISVGPVTPGGMVQSPSLAYMDQVKRELDKVIGAYRRAASIGTDPTAKAKASSLGGLRDRFVTDLDKNTTLPNGVSPYAQARSQFSSDQKVIDALRSGHDDFEGMTPQEVQETMRRYTPGSAERDAFQSGVAEHLLRRVGSTSTNVDAARKLISSPDLQAKVQALFDRPEDAENFIRSLGRESDMFNFSKEMQAAQKNVGVSGPKGAVISPHEAAAAILGSPWHQKIAGLRTVANMLPQKPFPDPGVSTIMSQTGGQGARTLEDLADAMTRFKNP